MGMDTEVTENEEIQRNIGKYFDHILKNIDLWKLSPSSVSNFKVPKLDSNSIANFGILQINSELERRQQELFAIERRKHRGYPILNHLGLCVITQNVAKSSNAEITSLLTSRR
eukprot:TRINITY_DN3002_c0_g1_i4.p1 TRINITY_DN3002_c0_g1~~TRINITY_DN3002_c0_g1_i4.p1  ORF type:complete len:113 (-),score=36.62 TRINITY_DN3002_c0_g1_i4:97-435(-)